MSPYPCCCGCPNVCGYLYKNQKKLKLSFGYSGTDVCQAVVPYKDANARPNFKWYIRGAPEGWCISGAADFTIGRSFQAHCGICRQDVFPRTFNYPSLVGDIEHILPLLRDIVGTDAHIMFLDEFCSVMGSLQGRGCRYAGHTELNYGTTAIDLIIDNRDKENRSRLFITMYSILVYENTIIPGLWNCRDTDFDRDPLWWIWMLPPYPGPELNYDRVSMYNGIVSTQRPCITEQMVQLANSRPGTINTVSAAHFATGTEIISCQELIGLIKNPQQPITKQIPVYYSLNHYHTHEVNTRAYYETDPGFIYRPIEFPVAVFSRSRAGRCSGDVSLTIEIVDEDEGA